jgi:DNA polymerase-3 subunit delta
VKLYPEQLGQHLKGTLARAYVLSGDEPLQLMEAADAIRQAGKSHGYASRERFHVDTNFEWGTFRAASDSYSLFGEPRILDIHLPAKPDKPGAEALLHFAERPPEDAILLVNLPKLTAAEQKARWYQAMERLGIVIQVWPLSGEKLLRWLDGRLNARGLLADQSGLRLLAARVEGNLLAAGQEVEKLHIIYGTGQLTDDQILKSVADSARYDVFDLTEQVLRGQMNKAFRVLMGLRGEGIASAVVLWALARELRLINTIKSELKAGASAESLFGKYRLWDSRKAAMSQALQRLNQSTIHEAILLSGRADRIIKGMASGDEWDALLAICISLMKPQSPSNSTRH